MGGRIGRNTQAAKRNLDVYTETVLSEIKELLSPLIRSELSEEQLEALIQVDALMDFRLMASTELADILMSEDWRHDIPMILGRVNPLFEQARDSLLSLEQQLASMVSTLREKSQQATGTLSRFLWGIQLVNAGLVAGDLPGF